MIHVRGIARALGVHPSTVSRRIKAGRDPWSGATPIPPPPPPPPPARPAADPAPTAARQEAVDPGLVAAGIKAGDTVAQIALDAGVSTATIYRAAVRHGLPIWRGRLRRPQTLRDAVQDMHPAEALEVVLEAYEQAFGQDASVHDFGRALGLTPAQSVILGAVMRGQGGTVPYERVLAICNAGRPDDRGLGVKDLQVQVCKMRKVLAGQVDLQTIWGVGLRLAPVRALPRAPADTFPDLGTLGREGE